MLLTERLYEDKLKHNLISPHCQDFLRTTNSASRLESRKKNILLQRFVDYFFFFNSTL